MRIFFRLLVYTLGLSLVLGYISYWVYISPSQVKIRLEQALGQFVAPPITIEGCAQPFLGDPTVGRISFPSRPVLVEPTLLALEDVQLSDPSTQLGRSLRRRLEAEAFDARVPPVRVSQAELSLDHEAAGVPEQGVPWQGGSRWNFDHVPKWAPILARLESNDCQVSIDRVLVQLQEVAPPRKTLRWRIEARDAEVRSHGGSGLVVDADLTGCEYWSEGVFRLAWSPVEGLSVRGGVDDFTGLERWLPLLPQAQRELWNTFRPVGPWNVDLEELRLPKNGHLTFRARVNNYDTHVKLGPLGVELRHLEGPMVVTESGGKIGKTEVGEKALAELLGIRVAVEGALDLIKGYLRLELPASPLETLLSPGEGPESSAGRSLVSFLRPVGQVEGSVNVSVLLGEQATLDGSVRFYDVEFLGLPFVRNLRGLIRFQRASHRPTVGDGKGTIKIHNAWLSGLGRAQGDIRFDWNANRLSFDFTDVKLSGEPLTSAGGVPDGSRSGGAFGGVSWGWETGFLEIDLRWMDAVLSCDLFRSRNFNGSFKKAGTSEPGHGEMNFGQITVPAARLWPEAKEMTFQSGKCHFRIDPGEREGGDDGQQGQRGAGKPRLAPDGRTLRITTCKFLGERQTLRATGTIALSGEADLVVLFSQGPTCMALEQLPDDSVPAQWKEATQGNYRAFRLSGNIGSPQVREIGDRDPAFVVGK